MSKVVTLTRNVPRRELLEDGFHKSRLASTIKPVALTLIPGKDEEPAVWKALPSKLPDNLWREPNTGVIMLKPVPILPQYWEDTSWVDFRLPKSEWDVAPILRARAPQSDAILAIDSTGAMHVRRDDPFVNIIPLLVTIALDVIWNLIRNTMVPILAMKQSLAANEGWAVWVHAPGIFTDRATDYLDIAFGNRYVLALKMNGTAALYLNRGSDIDPKWTIAEEFQYAQGGVDHNKPFQLTVIPWGYGYISFLFSQASEPSEHRKANIKTASTSAFLYNMADHEPENIQFDRAHNQWVKTPAAPLVVAIRQSLYGYGFAFSKVRYPSSEVLYVSPETFDRPKDWATPTIGRQGFEGQIDPEGSFGTLTASISNERGTDWLKAFDTQLIAQFNFSSSGMYTPELWSYDMDLDEKTWTPPWTPQDISNRWTYARFERTTDLDVSKAEFKLENSADYAKLLTGPLGPIQMQIDTLLAGGPVFDGYVFQSMPTLEDMNSKVVSQITCRDMWHRLNTKKVDDWKFLDGLNLLDVIKAMIKKCGFTEDDIEVTDPNGPLAELQFLGFNDPNDQKAVNPDGTVGDVLREIVKNYSLIPIRIRWVGSVWKIYLAPQYTGTLDPAGLPIKHFYINRDRILELQTKGAYKSDQTRWSESRYLMNSNPEFTIEEPEFNGLICKASTGTAGGAESLQAFMPAIWADPDSVKDPNSPWFIGYAKVKLVVPPEIVMPQTQGELESITRVYWERNHRRKPTLEILGEWQPGIDVDDFIWLKGVDQAFKPVSYGAWRIESMNVECTIDSRDDKIPSTDGTGTVTLRPRDMTWLFQCNYTLKWVGKAEDSNWKMFTTDNKLPI